MVSITECKKILNKNGISYDNEEVEKIREALYAIAEIVLNNNKNEIQIEKWKILV